MKLRDYQEIRWKMRSYIKEVDFETIRQRFDAFWEREVLERPSSTSRPQERSRRK